MRTVGGPMGPSCCEPSVIRTWLLPGPMETVRPLQRCWDFAVLLLVVGCPFGVYANLTRQLDTICVKLEFIPYLLDIFP